MSSIGGRVRLALATGLIALSGAVSTSSHLVAATVLSYTMLPKADSQNYDTEPYPAVDPTNANHIIVGWMRRVANTDLAAAQCWIETSWDGGATWLQQHLGGDSERNCADVSVAFAPDGSIYATRTAYIGPDGGQVYLHKSTDGGNTWSAPVVVYDALKDKLAFDRPWVFVDRSSTSPYYGTLYVGDMTAFAFYAGPHVYLKSSHDGGQTWSALVQVDDTVNPANHNEALETWGVGPDGTVMVAYRSAGSACSGYCFAAGVSTDGGQTFATHFIAQPNHPSSLTDGNENSYPYLAADPTKAGHFAVIFEDARFSNGMALDEVASSSTDSGSTWSAPVKVNDGAFVSGAMDDHSVLAYGANGVLYASWRDRRNAGTSASGTSPFDLYASVSTDGGATWSPNQRLNAVSSTAAPQSAGDDFSGEAVAPDGTAWTGWAILNSSSWREVWLAHWN